MLAEEDSKMLPEIEEFKMPTVISSQRNKINSESNGGNPRPVVGQKPYTAARGCVYLPFSQKDSVE